MLHSQARGWIMVLALTGAMATAVEPPDAPILRISPAMHTAPIQSVSTDAVGRIVLTASEDQTARLWELPGGRLLRTLRPPLGGDFQCMPKASALSSNGALAALAGMIGGKPCIYLFDTATGRVERRLTADTLDAPTSLSFSASGRLLAAAFKSRTSGSIHIWDTGTGLRVSGDERSADTLDWNGDEQLVASFISFISDGFGEVRLYQMRKDELQLLREVSVQNPLTLCFSPDGAQLAVSIGAVEGSRDRGGGSRGGSGVNGTKIRLV